MVRLLTALLLFLVMYPPLLQAQAAKDFTTDNIIFHRITTEQGLASDMVHCIMQDRTGFLWIGTDNGLSRYDGSRVIAYKNNPADSNSISNNDVLTLSEDADGKIWMGTYWKGLNSFDKATQRFSVIKNIPGKHPLANNTVFFLQSIDPLHLAIAQSELLVLNTKTRTSEFIPMPENTWTEKSMASSPKFSPYHICIDSRHKWWLSGEAGLLVYDPATRAIEVMSRRKGFTQAFNNMSSSQCAEDREGNIWISSGTGLWQYRPATGEMTQHYPTKFAKADCKTDFVRTFCCCQDGTIWFGTSNGLFHYSPSNGKYAVYRNHPLHAFSISNNDIHAIYEDRQHIMWVGTANGLNAIYPQTAGFKVYQNIPGDPKGLQSNEAKSSYKDPDGNLWVGTAKGVECIDKNTGQTSLYQYWDKRLKAQPGYFVMPLLEQDNNSFWVGTWGTGLQLFDRKQRKFIASYVYTGDTNNISSNFIHTISKDNSGDLWLATWNGGIEHFLVKSKIFVHYNTTNEPNLRSNYFSKVICIDNTVWGGNKYGVVRKKPGEAHFQFLNATEDSSNANAALISAIAPDQKGNIWIASFTGLTKYNSMSDRFEKSLAVENVGIFGVHVDRHGEVWLATNEGLKRYDPVKQTMIAYSLKDGLPVSYFPVETYFFESNDGEIFVSSNNGLIHFYPSDIKQNLAKPGLILTSLKIGNKEVTSLGDINALKKLELEHDQNYLSLNFAAMNYINPSQNQYAYMLEGIDHEWIMAGNRNEVIYPNLSPGNYVFRVKAANDAGVWNDLGIWLPIHISTPWWRTWWFYLLCALAVLGSIYALYKLRINQLLAEQKLRNKIARDLHDDIGSTLSGIKLFSNMAQHKLQQEKSEALGIIERIGERSEKMMEAMSDIVWSINPANDSMDNLLVRMKQYASEMMEPKNIQFHFEADERVSRLKISSEHRKDIYLIFKESVNNAVKHAGCNRVDIQLKIKGALLEMNIRDNGKGFDTSRQNGNGNGLHNFSQRAKLMGASIQISSEKEVGTCIRLQLPIT